MISNSINVSKLCRIYWPDKQVVGTQFGSIDPDYTDMLLIGPLGASHKEIDSWCLKLQQRVVKYEYISLYHLGHDKLVFKAYRDYPMNNECSSWEYFGD